MRALLLLAVVAAQPALARNAADKPAPMLTPADLDPVRVLPPPPVAGSAQAAAELAELRAIEHSRTPEQRSAAERDGDTKNATIFAGAIGPAFDLDRLPATGVLMRIVRATEQDAVERGKNHFRRLRPYAVDPTLAACKRNTDPESSYPSGHTTMAYAMGQVLARLLPARAEAILARAADYAQSRIVCEQHLRSDLTAGAMLGTIVAERLMAKPAFRDRFDAAQRELAQAGIR